MDVFADLRIEILCVERTVVTHHWNNNTLHSDPFNRYYLIESGESMVVIGGGEHKILPERLYIIPANAPFRIFRPRFEVDHWWIHFTARNSLGINPLELFELPLSVPAAEFPQARGALGRMWELCRTPSPGGRLESQALIRSCIVPFLRGVEDAPPGRLDDMRRFEEVTEYIERNLAKDLLIPRLARIMSYHPTYFANLFRKRFGIGPRQFICQKRVEKAQFLLKTTDQPIKEIAAGVGYADEMYFSRLFRKYVGLPPAAYRLGGRAS